MKNIIVLIVLIFAINVYCETGEILDGYWKGVITTSTGDDLEVSFSVTTEDNKVIEVVLNSVANDSLDNIKADSVSFEDKTIKLGFDSLSGSYIGKVENGLISGEWSQLNQKYALDLHYFGEDKLSNEEKQNIIGRWEGIFERPGNNVNIILNFERNENDHIELYLNRNYEGNRFIGDFDFDGKNISFSIIPGGPKFTGVINGQSINGTVSGPLNSWPGNLKKTIEDKKVNTVFMVEDKMVNEILGSWYGEIRSPRGTLMINFKFTLDENDSVMGQLDSPDTGNYDIPVKKIEVTNKGDVLIESMNGGLFKGGNLIDGQIAGEYIQQSRKYQTTLIKGDLPLVAIDMSREYIDLINGYWEGELNTPRGIMRVSFEFGKNQQNSIFGYYSNISMGVNKARISDASIIGNQLTISSQLHNFQYKAQIEGTEVLGKFYQNDMELSLKLTKTSDNKGKPRL